MKRVGNMSQECRYQHSAGCARDALQARMGELSESNRIMADAAAGRAKLLMEAQARVEQLERELAERITCGKIALQMLTREAEALRTALREIRKVVVVACGEEAPYIRVALKRLDAALSGERSDTPKTPKMIRLCTCRSHQFVDCRGQAGLGAGYRCEKELLTMEAADTPETETK